MLKIDQINIGVIGLGYVGLPLAVEFSKKYPVIGFDLDENRILELKSNFDKTNQLKKADIKSLKHITFTNSAKLLSQCNVYIITVPTPVGRSNEPDLKPLTYASKTVGKYLSKSNVVIYESTVFPHATEQICVPILELKSNLRYNIDFFCGYSPERINPGDKNKTLTKIKKITSGSTKDAAIFIDNLYKKIIDAGTHMVSSMAIAEAAKVIENTQRDVNIALVNELALIFKKLKLDSLEVFEAAETKWNFIPFRPGLVGGHCIGVDPYYLTHKALEVGYKPEIILAGRRINDSIGKVIADETIANLIKQKINPINANICILGLSFKENCSDIRNTKVISILKNLEGYGCSVSVSDDLVDRKEAQKYYGINLIDFESISKYECVIIAVGHRKYHKISIKQWDEMVALNGVIIDVKSLYSRKFFKNRDLIHWRL